MSLMCFKISLKPNLFSMMVFLAVSINATQMICNKNRFRLTRSVVTTFYFLCGPLYWRDIFSEHILWSLFLNTMFYSRQWGYFILMDILTPSGMDHEVFLWLPSHWFFYKRFLVLLRDREATSTEWRDRLGTGKRLFPNARDGKFLGFFQEKSFSREMAFGNADLYCIVSRFN